MSLLKQRLDQGKGQINNAQNYINLSYYIGKQWIHWDPTNKRVYEAKPVSGKSQFTANRIKKIVRTELAKIMKNKPIMTCIPASNEEDDIRAADVADKVISYLEHTHELNQMVDKRAIMWGLTTEAGYVHPYWNVGGGQTILDEQTGEEIKLGVEGIDVLSPFQLILDPDANSWDELKWAIKPKVRSIKYVKDVYNKEVLPDADVIENGISRQLDSLYESYGQKTKEKSKDQVTIYECWEMPDKENPKGRRWAIAGDSCLYTEHDIGFGEEDDTDRILPFFPFINIEIPGRIQGQSIIEDLIPLQREYNKSRSQIIDNADYMANPTWVVQDGAVDDESDIPTGSGGVFIYNSGFNVPVRDQPSSLGADVYKNLEALQDEFYFISGQQEVSHGSTPTGVTSGVAIGYLQEQDNTVIAPTISNFIQCKQGYVGYLLKIIKFKYDEPRTLQIVGKNNEVDLMEFKGSDLRSTDVIIQEGSMYAESKPARQQWIMNLIQAGVLDVVEHRDTIVQMLDIGNVDQIYDESQIDIEQAKKEQLSWEKGDFVNVIVRDFYNHKVHIAEHDKFRKNKVYEDMEPVFQSVIDMHILEHQTYMAKEQAAMIQQLMTQAAMDETNGNGGKTDDMSNVPSGTQNKGAGQTQNG